MIDLKGIVDSFAALTGLITRRFAILFLVAVYLTWLDSSLLVLVTDSVYSALNDPAISSLLSPAALDNYIGKENRQNAIFILVLILSIGTIYYAYLGVMSLGRLLPVHMIYSPTDVIIRSTSFATIIAYWPSEVRPRELADIIVEEISSKPSNMTEHWWKEAFYVCKSLIIITMILFIVNLRSINILVALFSIVVITMTMFGLTILESARYKNDLGSELRRYGIELRKKNEPRVTEKTAWDMWAKASSDMSPRWRYRPVFIGVSISYFGSPSEISYQLRHEVPSRLSRLRDFLSRLGDRIRSRL